MPEIIERHRGPVAIIAGAALGLGSTIMAGCGRGDEILNQAQSVQAETVALNGTSTGKQIAALAAGECVQLKPTGETICAATTTELPTTTTITEAEAVAARQLRSTQAASRSKPPRTVSASIAPANSTFPPQCEQYRPLVAQYDWPVNAAMQTMLAESGCDPNDVSQTNDYGLFQLHNMQIFDPAQNVAEAYRKFVYARVGNNNFSAWYAVCTPSRQPRYPGINCG